MLYNLVLIFLAMITGQLVAELKVFSEMVDPFEDDESDRSFDVRWIEPDRDGIGDKTPKKSPNESK
ncbi:hypothetical protein ACFL35_13135 [Candidatus Riflebacteria bacterium]